MIDGRKEEIALVDFDPKKDQVIDLWYQDAIEFGHGISLRIKIKTVLFNARSPYQEITIMETERLGRILVIDGITMLTEWDEYAYHEMISHVPLLVHPNPSRILIIGGGDGGTAREVIKHPSVESVHVCELDEEVVDACKKYLPSLASSFKDPRVKVFYEDGAKFITKHPESYDIIIVDSTDPLGPGQILFQEPFYQGLKEALRGEGIAVTQCESFFLHQHVIRGVFSFARNLFPKLGYYSTLVPTYPSGVIGFFFCSLRRDPVEDIEEERFSALQGLRYYTPKVHRASFTLPRFAADLLRP
jgi:spermidine synthase